MWILLCLAVVLGDWSVDDECADRSCSLDALQRRAKVQAEEASGLHAEFYVVPFSGSLMYHFAPAVLKTSM